MKILLFLSAIVGFTSVGYADIYDTAIAKSEYLRPVVKLKPSNQIVFRKHEQRVKVGTGYYLICELLPNSDDRLRLNRDAALKLELNDPNITFTADTPEIIPAEVSQEKMDSGDIEFTAEQKIVYKLRNPKSVHKLTLECTAWGKSYTSSSAAIKELEDIHLSSLRGALSSGPLSLETLINDEKAEEISSPDVDLRHEAAG